MIVYPFLLFYISIIPLTYNPDWRVVLITYYEDFNIDTGYIGTETQLSATCHKNSISMMYSSGYLEINFSGKKFISYTNGTNYYDGNSIVLLDCYSVGATLSSQI